MYNNIKLAVLKLINSPETDTYGKITGYLALLYYYPQVYEAINKDHEIGEPEFRNIIIEMHRDDLIEAKNIGPTDGSIVSTPHGLEYLLNETNKQKIGF